jgi:hypothetical protein
MIIGIRSRIQKLEKEIRDEGFETIATDLKFIQDRVKESIYKDMDLNKDVIVDDIEMALYSRELPDRLLFYRGTCYYASGETVELCRCCCNLL